MARDGRETAFQTGEGRGTNPTERKKSVEFEASKKVCGGKSGAGEPLESHRAMIGKRPGNMRRGICTGQHGAKKMQRCLRDDYSISFKGALGKNGYQHSKGGLLSSTGEIFRGAAGTNKIGPFWGGGGGRSIARHWSGQLSQSTFGSLKIGGRMMRYPRLGGAPATTSGVEPL